MSFMMPSPLPSPALPAMPAAPPPPPLFGAQAGIMKPKRTSAFPSFLGAGIVPQQQTAGRTLLGSA